MAWFLTSSYKPDKQVNNMGWLNSVNIGKYYLIHDPETNTRYAVPADQLIEREITVDDLL